MSTPRVISGSARGIRLQMVPGDITRPITDMVKESLFNILGAEDIADSTWLDLFGGTGSVGIEALSRGAVFARFIDLNRAAITTIQTNLEKTHLMSRAEILQSDAFAFLKRSADRSFDYIYIAPPQYKGMWEHALHDLDDNTGWTQADTWVIVQIDPLEYSKQALNHLVEFEQRRYGNTLLVFYERI
ncbi:MAG TPA: 16S rRNA (guanine(966)-N(2))-methyltransferase RsmD [Anaerolineaceae bacterium]